MDLTTAELADVIDDPFIRREILRALEEAEAVGGLAQSDVDLLREHEAELLMLNDDAVDGILLLVGSELAMAKLIFGGASNG